MSLKHWLPRMSLYLPLSYEYQEQTNQANMAHGSLIYIPNLSEFQKSLSFRKSRCFINVLMRFYWIFNQKYILDRAFRFLSEKFPVLNLELFLFHHFYNLQKFLKCIYQEMSFVPVSIATFCSLFSD